MVTHSALLFWYLQHNGVKTKIDDPFCKFLFHKIKKGQK